MKIRNRRLKIQSTFSDREIRTCKSIFSLQDDESLMFIWWIQPLKEEGVVFTDKRIFWNISTTISGENEFERYHRSWGEIIRSEKSFLELTIDDGEVTIHTKEKRYSFRALKFLSNIDLQRLDKIFKDYFDNIKSLDAEINTFRNSFFLAIENLLQKISIPDNEEDFSYAKTTCSTAAEKTKSGNDKPLKIKKTALKTVSAIRHCIDFILDIYALLVLTICYFINSTVNSPEYKKIWNQINYVLSRSDFLIIMLFISVMYFILKTLIICTAKNVKKYQPMILVIVQILVWLMANDKYLFLLLVNFLLTYLFQSLCNFSKNSIRLKFTLYFVIIITAFLSITFFI